VEQHAGEITVRSTAGEGTEFTVTLPATAAVAVVKTGA
jgi:signal transduction histidine kinase